jgi:LmbE family N-acetylglucosaminyl deacetylase
MMPLSLAGIGSLVVIAAHADDAEIGAGGFLLQLPAGIRVHYVVCTGSPERHAEARAAAAAFLPEADLSFELHDLPDGRLPAHWTEVKDLIGSAARALAADVVLTPSRTDLHQDHRLIAELAPTEFRDSLILQYEIPKWDGDRTRGRVYLPVPDELLRRKVELLSSCYPSQVGRDWWDDELFLGVARQRGMECRSRYAEAFEVDKLIVGTN